MEILSLKTNQLNQNNYNKNTLTPEFIGSLVTYPIDYTHEKCLPCDGYKLKITDYEQLYAVIGSKFNDGTEESDEFRIPDYNITGRFLQPGIDCTTKIEAGLPNITGLCKGVDDNSWTFTGAFYLAAQGGSSGGTANGNRPGFDASRCSPIYGNSTTVQPPSQVVHICIRYK